MEHTTPTPDNRPNVDDLHFDIMAELFGEQIALDECDEFEQMSKGLSVQHDINERLENHVISINIETSSVGIQVAENDDIDMFCKEDGSTFNVYGDVVHVGLGYLNGVNAYMVVVASMLETAESETKLCHAYVHLKSIENYQYRENIPKVEMTIDEQEPATDLNEKEN